MSPKNFSPQQLAALAALALAIPISLSTYFLEPNWWVVLTFFLIIFSGSYGLIVYTLQHFVYRKIKLIYKLIYQTKASKREEFYYNNILPQKSIEEVRADVETWAKQRKAEIEVLKQNKRTEKNFCKIYHTN
jgi:two-component system phosphate regulon sensor histidine kinase PhoR